MTRAVDVAIVGAGPAGAWTAYVLARRGARVALVDPSHPREKPCGGGVTGRALALVADALDRPLPSVTVRRARFTSPGRPDASVDLDATALLVASRAAFDAALLDAACRAGATLVAERARDIRVDATGASVLTATGSVRADWLIGADGATSLVRRRLARPLAPREFSTATGFFAAGVTSDEILIELTDDPPGYMWSFPRPDHLAIGICAQTDTGTTVARLRARALAWIERTGIAPGARLDPYSWPIPSLDSSSLSRLVLTGPRWCLVGDAAGLVDPITREGIYFALLSGGLAAETLARGAGPAEYAGHISAGILPELTRAARLKAGFFRPAFTDLLTRALANSAPIRAVMADLVAGRQPYRGLRRRLLGTFEWKLAWRAFVTGRNSRHEP